MARAAWQRGWAVRFTDGGPYDGRLSYDGHDLTRLSEV